MKKLFVFFLKNSEIILFFYNLYFKLLNKQRFISENKRRQELSIFDYKALSQPIPYYPEEKIRDSNYYGYAQAIRKYAGIDKLNAALEHGLYLGNRISTAEGYRTTRSVIAMSNNRVDSFKIHGLNKPIIAIGPYIHYANSLLSEEEKKEIKHKYGKILVFLSRI